uniref:G-patch domain-containing protein n=1 Tax=Globisporangium ultimum (strain ATCC 200006 / CBS 805.95 / DAOM BR144) TaxID=431595 RepID=K3WXR3_GLOUD
MEPALDASNRGFQLLQKMGWRNGTGLGKHEQGIVEPIKMKENLVCLGLGKAEEYDAMNEQATKERRKLDSEVVETTEATQVRLEKAARDDQIKSDVKAIESAFFCQDCQKQYKTVKEMENHLSSYDHHHRKRLQELKKSSLSTDELELKRKREQQHEAMVLQKRIENAAAVAAGSSVAQSQKESSTSSAVDNTLQRGKLATTKIGFSFGGKAKAKGTVGAFGAKKSPKKIVTLASAFASP